MLTAQVRLMLVLERRAFTSFRRRLNDQAAEIAEIIAKAQPGDEADAAREWLADEAVAFMQPTIERVTDQSARSFGVLARDQMPEEPKQETAEQKYQRLIAAWVKRNGLGQAKLLRGESKRRILQLISAGVMEGLGPEAIGRAVEEQLRIDNRGRAVAIARTETHNAAMVSSQARADASILELLKEWLAIIDGRERSWHGAVDGKRVKKNEKFSVGPTSQGITDRMDHPGDTSASAANVVHCRCGLLWIEARRGVRRR